MIKIFYIHGFNSGGTSSTVDLLRSQFPNDIVIANSYPLHIPSRCMKRIVRDALNVMEDTMDDGDDFVIVGTSMGGFWTEMVSKIVGAKCVLINPCRHPSNQLKKHLGVSINFSTNIPETLTEEALTIYQKFEIIRDENSENRFPMISLVWHGDKLIDSLQTVREMADLCEIRWYGGGQHLVSEKEIGLVSQAIRDIVNSVVGEI